MTMSAARSTICYRYLGLALIVQAERGDTDLAGTGDLCCRLDSAYRPKRRLTIVCALGRHTVPRVAPYTIEALRPLLIHDRDSVASGVTAVIVRIARVGETLTRVPARMPE